MFADHLIINISPTMSGTVAKKVYNMYERRQSIPIIYVRGTHYDVGYDVVRKWNWLFAE